MEPCLVPFTMEKMEDLEFPHFTQAYWSSYTLMMTLTTIAGIPLSSSLWNSMLNWQVSKALEQSNKVMMGQVLFLRKWLATSMTSQLHWVVLVPTL